MGEKCNTLTKFNKLGWGNMLGNIKSGGITTAYGENILQYLYHIKSALVF